MRMDAVNSLKVRYNQNPTSENKNDVEKKKDEMIEFHRKFGDDRSNLGELFMGSGFHLRTEDGARLDYALGRVDNERAHSNEVS